jgi:hypothetical protein
MAAFQDVWERLKEQAAEIAREGTPCTPERAQEVVRQTLKELEFEGIPESVKQWLVTEFCGFVDK